MALTILKRVTLRNWATVRHAEVEFPESGLVLVRGINTLANGKMASIGSGKTALGEAISRALLAVRGRFTNLGKFSTNGKGNSYVKVEVEHNGKPLTVELGFKAKEINLTGEGLKFTYDGQTVYRDNNANTRSDLAKILTVPPALACWTVHLDGDSLNFNDLAERNAVGLLMAALRQPAWTMMSKSANEAANEYRRDVTNADQALTTAKDDASEARDDVNAAEARLAEAKTDYEQQVAENSREITGTESKVTVLTEALKQRAVEREKVVKEIDRRTRLNAAKIKQAEEKTRTIQSRLDEARDAHSEAREEQSGAAADERSALGELNRAKTTPKNCPTCSKPWDKGDTLQQAAHEKHEKAAAVRKAADAAVTAAKKRFDTIQTEYNAAYTAWETLRDEAPIDELSTQCEDMDSQTNEDNRTLRTLDQTLVRLRHGPDKTEVTRAETTVTERKATRTKLDKKVTDAAAKLSELKQSLSVVQYWQQAFSASGIPNMVLHDAMAPLNTISKHLSARMTGGTLDVSYATSRALASGDQKAELVINVKNTLGSHSAEGSSKGERGLTNLIIAETLAEVGGIASRIGYRWYDEVCPNQDEVVRRSIYTYMAEIAARHNILVFLVDHNAEAANYAQHVLIAEKTVKGTAYRWS